MIYDLVPYFLLKEKFSIVEEGNSRKEKKRRASALYDYDCIAVP
jgi:hypothetical protein